eukprot:TRINITY_DN34049_c0_g1_i1.p2 TRINITY_DN34049_c0_g1~~TRINITY_DN34049_c0_g1_i1.p2  ORF type:complete len:251 (+),score=48.55 TRINITY_DN34049_c0_g1_i1:32-784(+)
MYPLLTVLLLLLTCFTQAALLSCEGTVDGVHYDLTPARRNTGYYEFHTDDPVFTYFFNVCDYSHLNTTTRTDCGDTIPPAPLVQIVEEGRCEAGSKCCNLGLLSSQSKFSPLEEEDGITVTYDQGDMCGGSPRTTQVSFVCDSSTDGEVKAVAEDNCHYTVTFHTKYACSTSGDALSGGWVFIIIVLTLVVLYLVSGIMYRRSRLGVTGWESLPNVEFWRQFPGLVKDGCVFSFTWFRDVAIRRRGYTRS